ncbi:MAG TPA: peptidoglycan-binding domain-containing protein, partial [Herpetosiphonaceae bacterium]
TLKLTDPPMESEAVTKVQERLIELGYMQPPASGKYDEATMRAVRRFQENAAPGTKGDGKVGSITLGNLENAAALPVSATANLSHDDAAQRLTDAGIDMDSTDDCSDRTNGRCTSLDQIQSVSIDGVVRLREESGLPITVTGGTEIGHDNGFEQSHTNGHKIDIRRDADIDNYIETNYTRIADRGSHPQYQDANGNVYAKEGNHWDITYVNVPPAAPAPAADPAAAPTP